MITLGICKLFLVDDDREELDIVIEDLRDRNIVNLIEFTNDTELFQNIAEGDDPAIIILDHKMPRTNGVEITRRLKMINRHNFIIGLSGIRDPDILEQYINCDIDRWVNKQNRPFTDQLVEYITKGVERIKEIKEIIVKLKDKIDG